MYLLLRPDGSRYWRLDYRFEGKRKTLALGVYPEISLAEARRGVVRRNRCCPGVWIPPP